MKIRVTKKFIKEGRRHESECCPVALALRAAGYKHVEVGTLQINFICVGGSQRSLRPPQAVSKFVIAFDDGRPVKPFTFEMVDP